MAPIPPLLDITSENVVLGLMIGQVDTSNVRYVMEVEPTRLEANCMTYTQFDTPGHQVLGFLATGS
jgi:hypothetical protein